MRTIFHDPRTKYPTPLFPKQEQEMPGFEKKNATAGGSR